MKKKITIIGAGPCALMLGCTLNTDKYEVAVYEKNAAPGRKFLVAGDGGLNLTHAEDPAVFLTRYTPPAFMAQAFGAFSNHQFVSWLNAQGLETYVGSSKRVFPKKGIKPVEVLNLLLEKIKQNGVTIYTRHTWKGFDEKNCLLFEYNNEQKTVSSDLVIFCLGGASWPVTGSAGDWAPYFSKKNICVLPFAPSNCAFKIIWPHEIGYILAGKALKNCAFSCGNKTQQGEAVLTAFGIEGSGVYPLSPQIREQLLAHDIAQLSIDLKPSLSREALLKKFKKTPGKKSYTAQLTEQLNLSPLHLTLLKYFVPKDDFMDAEKLVTHLKDFKLSITGLAPLDEAISSVGGIALDELNEQFELNKLPDHFAIGEMLDYDAPTGGYLLQSCFSMAKYLSDLFNAESFFARSQSL